MTNSFKLKFCNSSYLTTKDENGKSKSVTCFMTAVMNLPVPFTQRLVKKYKNANFSFVPSDSNVILSCVAINITATATCHSNDKFEFIKGKHVSETKAKSKTYSLAKRILVDLYNDYTKDKVSAKANKMDETRVSLSPISMLKANINKFANLEAEEIEHSNFLNQ